MSFQAFFLLGGEGGCSSDVFAFEMQCLQGIGNPRVTKRDALILGFLHIDRKSVVSLVAVFFSNFSLIHFLFLV